MSKYYGYFNKAWKIFGENVGEFIGFFLLSGILLFIVALIPYIGNIFTSVMSQALMVGLYIYLYNKEKRNYGEFGDLFNGFSHFGDLFLFSILQSLLIILILSPFFILFVLGVEQTDNMTSQYETIIIIFSFIVLCIGGIILTICYALFSLSPFLIAFSNLSAYQAMKMSYKLMKPNVVSYFLLSLVLMFIFMVAMIPCGLGLFVAIPFMQILFYLAFKDITMLDNNTSDDSDSLLDHLV